MQKKCAYSLSESLNSSKLEEMAYADYNKLKSTYKYLGIDEDQYGCKMEENVKRIYEAIEKSLNLVFSSPLSIGDMIKAINTCILPKVLYIFSHQGEPTLRSKIAQKIDLIIRKFMNEHKVKMSKITNTSLYLSQKNMGLGLKNTQIELDKINLKLYVQIHYSKLFKDLRDKLIGFKNLFDKLANIYGLKIEYQDNHLIINEKIFDSGKECNKYIVESIDKVDESFWLTKYSKNRIYPTTVVSQKLFTPWTWYNDLSPKMYKNITMIQESIHPQLNNPANPNSKCELKNKDGHKCNKFDHPYHIFSECELNNGNKRIRHNKILHQIINTISMAKAMKFISNEDSRKPLEFKNLKICVDQPFSFNLIMHHSRPDLVFYMESKIIVAKLCISSCKNLETAATIKTQRYTLFGEKELKGINPKEKSMNILGGIISLSL